MRWLVTRVRTGTVEPNRTLSGTPPTTVCQWIIETHIDPLQVICGKPVLKRAARIADGFVSPNTTADEIKVMIDKIHGYRKEYGTDQKPFHMVSVAIDAFDLDGHKRLVDMGVDECCDMPWLYYGGKFKSPVAEKIDAMKRFTDEVIAKL